MKSKVFENPVNDLVDLQTRIEAVLRQKPDYIYFTVYSSSFLYAEKYTEMLAIYRYYR